MTPERQKRLFVYDWQAPDAPTSFAPLADLPYSLFLDSNKNGHALNRYSYILWHPFEMIESTGGRVTVTNRDHQVSYTADIFKVVRERLALWGEDRRPEKNLPPFQGGAAGFFGYDLARQLERLPSRTEKNAQPDACIGLYDKVLAFDHAAGKAYLMIFTASEAEAIVHKTFLENRVRDHQIRTFGGTEAAWKTDKDDKAFEKDIARVIEYIHAGDIFQANLSRRFSASIPHNFDAFAHYEHLRAINPAPYAAFMNFGAVKLASCSPERFLEVKGRVLETRPIKGTMASSLPASALSESEKDRAENVMIVDLLRNDLSKVCEDHSIEVTALCDIETFEGLHHMVSTVRGTLRGDQSAMDALRACFPGGSVTGAPKIRAMEIIEELEPNRRGAYCGALAWIGFDGAMDSAITIRTLVYEGEQAHLQTGGGIIADSVAKKELAETLTKAEKIFESFLLPSSLRRFTRNDGQG
jgi:para-aminobenzoate synthetase component 1